MLKQNCSAFTKESRTKFAIATKFNRKSGVYPDFLPRSTGQDHVFGFH
jgi:hypothetical protein